MKPVCKAESRYLFWRYENPRADGKNFRGWEKKMMRRARRRFLNKQADFQPKD